MNIHIVGMGLAGSLLWWELRRLGVSATVADTFNAESSSRVAAGMITPITGMRLKPSWRFDELCAIAQHVYAEISDLAGSSLMREWKLRRVFKDERQQEWFGERYERGEYENVTLQYIEPGVFHGVRYPFGGMEHNSVFTVEIEELINAIVTEATQQQQNIVAEHSISVLCSGYQAVHDPQWSWIPIEPSKGEILDVSIPGLQMDYILTNGTWILPGNDGTFRIGATHDWTDVSPAPTEAARKHLLENVEQLVAHEIRVLNQRAAIRPSTRFKRPLVGRHPENDRQCIFTGLGTKGAVQGPWAARNLARHLVLGEPLDPEINVQRWYKR